MKISEVITPSLASLKEELEHELVEAENPKALVQKIVQISKTPKKLDELSKLAINMSKRI